MKIEKSQGLNLAEQYLKGLCDRTFLSLWSYPNVYRDQGINSNKEGKELCDLLVVCGSHVIIFSDKHCVFPNTGDLQLDWQRWYKRAVTKAAEQAWGAVRWIQQFPDRVFIDKQCRIPFPIKIDVSKPIKYHLVVVAHGASNRCIDLHGGSGSLMFKSEINGESNKIEPFTLTEMDVEKPFVHIFDDRSTNIILKTRDTIQDFTDYLEKKEKFVRSNKKIFYAGEEELLAHYLKYVNEEGEHDFIIENKQNNVAFLEGIWEEFSSNPQRLAQLEADKVSYAWDRLIDTFGQHALNDTAEFTIPKGINTSERILRFLAKEPRTRRRLLAKALVEVIENTPSNKQRVRYCLGTKVNEPTYVFLIFPCGDKENYPEYRKRRSALLAFYCRVAKVRHPKAIDIIGIATEPSTGSVGSSEDALYFNAEFWTDRDQQAIISDMAEIGISTKAQSIKYGSEDEYPNVEIKSNQKTKNMRNKPCPCGKKKPDGTPIKYKHCHGKIN